MKWIKLSFRNILRNKRRSLITIAAIGFGYAAISLSHGYMHNAYQGLRNVAISAEGLSHLRINKPGGQGKAKLDPGKTMFSEEETKKIIRLVGEEDGVVVATPQIQVTGMVSNGETTTVFIGQGVIPKDDRLIKRKHWHIVKKGKEISEENPRDVEMSTDLARYLNLNPGDAGVVMASTVNGYLNALDMRVCGIYDTGNDFSNDKFVRLNFYFAQSLLATKSAERIAVLLKDWKKTERMRKHLLKKLKAAGIDCEIRTWKQLSMVYAKSKSYLDMIFVFLFSIVVVIVMITTINTMGMAILERTQEIGTLRALGLKRRAVSMLFALEGAFLGFFGGVLGCLLHTAVWAAIKIHPPYYIPPGFSVAVSMRVNMVPLMLVFLFFTFIVVAAVAAIITARKAAGKNIVDALGHV